jgi:DNA-binding MarR family transcriptional regulator
MNVDAGTGEIPELMMSLMRQFSVARTRLSAARRDDAPPAYLLAKIGQGAPRRAGELAAELCADPSTVSRQVAMLVRSGLVQRQADPGDGRASILVLTDAGRERLEQLFRQRESLFGAVVADWTESDRQDFARLFRRYVESFESHRDDLIDGLIDSSQLSH